MYDGSYCCSHLWKKITYHSSEDLPPLGFTNTEGTYLLPNIIKVWLGVWLTANYTWLSLSQLSQPFNQPTQEPSCLKQHLKRTDTELTAKETSVNQISPSSMSSSVLNFSVHKAIWDRSLKYRFLSPFLHPNSVCQFHVESRNLHCNKPLG